jgi:hypothetical protein
LVAPLRVSIGASTARQVLRSVRRLREMLSRNRSPTALNRAGLCGIGPSSGMKSRFDDNDIAPGPLEPAVNRDHAIRFVYVERSDRRAAKGGMIHAYCTGGIMRHALNLTCTIVTSCVVALLLSTICTAFAADGCAPKTTCLAASGTGAPAQFVAQCSGKFPDFVTPVGMVPTNGPWFKLSQAYPSTAPVNDAPWLSIDFMNGVAGANSYLYALRDYAFDGMIAADFTPELNTVRQWFHMPMMNFGPPAREPSRGLTSERTLVGPELGIKPGVSVHNYAIGFYNAVGAVTIGQVWKTNSPDVTKARFSQGAMTFKILFSDAKASDFDGPDILAGAPTWTIATTTGQKPVRLMQMDVAAVDARSPTRWVFGTFAFDRSASDSSPWLRLRPVGISWGNDYGFTPADQQAGKKLKETTISDQAPAYAAAHLGWAGRTNGPIDNPISGCLSCHSTAQDPVAAITFNNACVSDTQKMFWFRDFPGTQFFGAVDSTCTPTPVDPNAVHALDFSLQMGVSVQNVRQRGDVNPCDGSSSPASGALMQMGPGEHPLIAR